MSTATRTLPTKAPELTPALRFGRLSTPLRPRILLTCALLLLACVALTGLALMLGERTVTPAEVVAALRGEASRFVTLTVVEWRLPRALAAIAVGLLLGAAGAIFQTLTRNPLGSPDIIGFTTGAHTGGLIVILLFGSSYLAVTGGALAGGLLTAVVVLLLARRGSIQGFRLIIVGVALTSMLASIDTWLILTADLDASLVAATWGVGSLNGAAWPYVAPSIAACLLALALAVPLSRPLSQLDLGDDCAQVTGARPERTKLAALALGVLMVAIATSVAGPVAFVALAAPQIGRRLARAQGTPLAPAACTGALLLLLADVLAQHVVPGPGVPVGVVTVSLGGVYLLFLIVSENRKGTL